MLHNSQHSDNKGYSKLIFYNWEFSPQSPAWYWTCDEVLDKQDGVNLRSSGYQWYSHQQWSLSGFLDDCLFMHERQLETVTKQRVRWPQIEHICQTLNPSIFLNIVWLNIISALGPAALFNKQRCKQYRNMCWHVDMLYFLSLLFQYVM